MEKTVVLEEYAKTRSRKSSNLKKYGLIALFLGPFLLAFLIFFVYPLGYGIYISLTKFTLGRPDLATWNDFDNYKILLDSSNQATSAIILRENFWNSFTNTLVFSVIMVPLAILVPLFLAILINTKPPAFKAFRAMIYLPSIVPLTAAGSIFMIIFNPGNQYGLLAQWFGIDQFNWFNDIMLKFTLGAEEIKVPYAWVPIFLMCFWGGWGGNFIILNAGLQNVSKSLYEAASIDGCTSWKKTLYVTIPGIKPQLVLCLFTTIIGYLGLYGQNFTLTSGGPTVRDINSKMPGGGGTSTIMYFIQDIVANNATFQEKLYGLGAAASLIFALFVGIISGIQMWCTRDKKTGTRISEAYHKWHRVR